MLALLICFLFTTTGGAAVLAEHSKSASCALAAKTELYPNSTTGKAAIPPGQQDPKCVFTNAELDKKLVKQDGKCASCGKETAIDDARGHLQERHADGGKCDDSNHVILLEDCHKEVRRL